MVDLQEWQEVNIGKDTILKARIGWQGLTTNEYRDNGKYYLVTGTDFENGLVNWDACHFVDKWRFEQDKNIQLQVNDVLITKDGTIGKAGFVETLRLPTTLNSGVFVIRPTNSKLQQKYLYYVFTSKIFDEFLNKLTAGSTINHLYQKDFIKFTFKVPPKEEQKAIVKVLSDTDELISTLEKLISKKEAIKQGTMQQLLTGKKRLNGFSGEWEEKRLEEIVVKFQNGFAFSAKGYVKYGMPIVTMAQIGIEGNFQFDINKVNCWDMKKTNELKNFFLNKNDVIIAMTDVTPEKNLIGRMTIVNESQICLLNQRVGHLVLDEKQIIPSFLTNLSNMPKWRLYSVSIASLGVQANIGTKDIMNGIIKIPKIQEQQAIAQILSDMGNEIKSLKQKLSKTKAIKDGMMSELLTGKTRLIKNNDKTKKHNIHFEDAVIIGVLSDLFSSDRFPLGRKRYTKLSYLLHRKKEHSTQQYLKKAAGPYNHKTKYGGAEKIALNKNYIKHAKSGKLYGFVSDKNSNEAKEYFIKWFGDGVIDWLEQFRYYKNDKLELLATVDMAMQDLVKNKQTINLENVKTIIKSDKEWKPKLEREIFSNENIENAINTIYNLFGSNK